MAALEENVLRLDVAVDDAQSVRRTQRVGHLARDAERVFEGKLPFPLQSSAQGLPAHVGHDIEEEAVGGSGIQQRQNVGMLQPGRGLDLAQEPLATQGRPEIGMQHLDSDLAVMAEIVGEVHRRHAALSELALDPVAVRERRGEPLGGGHLPPCLAS